MALTSPALLTIRLDQLKALRQAWDGAQAKPPSFDAIRRAREFAAGFNIVPQSDGGVTLVFANGVEVVRISPGGVPSYPKAKPCPES